MNQTTALVETSLDRRRIGDMKIDKFSGLTFGEYREAVEFAKLVAQAKHSIPAYLKQNPGDCLAIITQALRWRMEPFWLAQHSYIARADETSLIAYDAAVHAAIVLSVANINGRPRYSYQDEGDQRTCTVQATFVGETAPHTYTTPPLGKCRPPRNERGQIKGSPLWEKDPDQQLGYYAIRNWGRRYCPDLLGGVYDVEEFEHTSQELTTFEHVTNPLGDAEGDEVPAGHPGPPVPRQAGPAGNGAAAPSPAPQPEAAAPTQQQDNVAKRQQAQVAPEEVTGARQAVPVSTGAEARNIAIGASSEAGEASKPKPDSFPEPHVKRTGDEYVAYCLGWIARESSATGIDDRWKRERRIRNSLGTGSLDENQLATITRAKMQAEARIKDAGEGGKA